MNASHLSYNIFFLQYNFFFWRFIQFSLTAQHRIDIQDIYLKQFKAKITLNKLAIALTL